MPSDAERYLDTFLNYEATILSRPDQAGMNLARMRRLLSLLGDPQKDLPIVHVAGSKGKGSVSAMTAHILRAAGHTVGLYTSPHLYHPRERIRVLRPGGGPLGEPGDLFPDCIPLDAFADFLNRLRPLAERLRGEPDIGPPTYFEVLTAMALDYFARCPADVVVLETGLGGRLDATNVTLARVCGITPISLEHTRFLGATIAEIAGEKAAIIKDPAQLAVTARQRPEARAVIHARCRRVGCALTDLDQDFSVSEPAVTAAGQRFVVRGPGREYPLTLSLLGAHQAENAAMAIALVAALSRQGVMPRPSPEVIARGLAGVDWPGRFEILPGAPAVVLDCAHTVDSVERCCRTLEQIFPGRRRLAVLGLSADKDWAGIGQTLSGFVDGLVLTRSGHPRARAWSAAEAQQMFPGGAVSIQLEIGAALDEVRRQARPADVIVVLGSVYVVAEARQRLLARRPPGTGEEKRDATD